MSAFAPKKVKTLYVSAKKLLYVKTARKMLVKLTPELKAMNTVAAADSDYFGTTYLTRKKLVFSVCACSFCTCIWNQ
jgi:hypothetical protein